MCQIARKSPKTIVSKTRTDHAAQQVCLLCTWYKMNKASQHTIHAWISWNVLPNLNAMRMGKEYTLSVRTVTRAKTVPILEHSNCGRTSTTSVLWGNHPSEAWEKFGSKSHWGWMSVNWPANEVPMLYIVGHPIVLTLGVWQVSVGHTAFWTIELKSLPSVTNAGFVTRGRDLVCYE